MLLTKPLFQVLVALRRWRGSWLDPFRSAPERRRDLEIVQQYEQVKKKLKKKYLPISPERRRDLEIVQQYESRF